MYARSGSTAADLALLGDADLVRLLKLGHDEALEVLLHRHRDALYRFCCHLMTSREDAEDVCQETLARAMTRVDSLQVESAFRSWLFSIARNLSIDSYRSKKRTCSMPDEEAIPLPLYGETLQDRIETTEERQTVAEALGKLAQSHQRVLVLREVDGLSYAAIAEELKVSHSAVETLLFRARRRLREEYTKSAIPVLAIASGLRDLAARFAAPVASGPILAKIAVSTALVGGGLTTTHVASITPKLHQRAQAQHSAAPVRVPRALFVGQSHQVASSPQTSGLVMRLSGAASGRARAASPTRHKVSRTSIHTRTRHHSSRAPSSSASPASHSKASRKQRDVSHPFGQSSALPASHPIMASSAPSASHPFMPSSAPTASYTAASPAPVVRAPAVQAAASPAPSTAQKSAASSSTVSGSAAAPVRNAPPGRNKAPRKTAPGQTQSGTHATAPPQSKTGPVVAPSTSHAQPTYASQKPQGSAKGRSSHGNPHASAPSTGVAQPVVPQPAVPQPTAASAPGKSHGNSGQGQQNPNKAPTTVPASSGSAASATPASPPTSNGHGNGNSGGAKGKGHGH